MKIGHPADKPVAAGTPADAGTAKAGPAHGAAAPTAAAADPSATVALSSTAATLLSGGASGEFDAEKVARMSAAIASGDFKINAEAIADKLIANAQELLVKVKT
jgi:negative regulator of flagellin synthesis FlgM